MNWIIKNLITNKRNNTILYVIVIGLLVINFSNLIKQPNIKLSISVFIVFVTVFKTFSDYWYRHLYRKNQKILDNIKELSKNGEYQEIVNNANKIRIIKPHILEKTYWLGFANVYLNNPKFALECFNRVEKDFPDFSGLFYHKGLSLIDLNRNEEAIDILTYAIKLDKNWQNYDQRGVAYMNINEYELAEKDFVKSIELKIDHSNTCNLGVLNDKKGNHKKAIEFYNKSIEAYKENANAFHNRGLANYYLENFEKSIEDYTKVLEINPKRDGSLYKRAIAYQAIKKYDLAIKDFDKAEELGSKNEYLFLNRGICEIEKGDKKSGLRDLKKALELDCAEAEGLIKKNEHE